MQFFLSHKIRLSEGGLTEVFNFTMGLASLRLSYCFPNEMVPPLVTVSSRSLHPWEKGCIIAQMGLDGA